MSPNISLAKAKRHDISLTFLIFDDQLKSISHNYSYRIVVYEVEEILRQSKELNVSLTFNQLHLSSA